MEDALSEIVIIVGNEIVISCSKHGRGYLLFTLRKCFKEGKESTFSTLHIGKYWVKSGAFALVRQPGNEKENSKFKLAIITLKTNFESNPSEGERVLYMYINDGNGQTM